MRKGLFLLLILMAVLSPKNIFSQTPPVKVEGRVLCVHPTLDLQDKESVKNLVAQCRKAHINSILVCFKLYGKVLWNSKKFADAVPDDFKKKFEQGFDPLKEFITECHKNGIRVHAFICNFTDEPNLPAYKEHPEWAMLNKDGKPTTSEFLSNNTPYFLLWMCPARRPGYTDQWLIPMIEEIVTDYDVDGINHDYIRYPGDVSPDGYCFCDYCLENFLKYNHLYYECKPDTQIEAVQKLPTWISNWSQDNTIKPTNWDKMTRAEKVDFILKGSSMKGGPADLDYFYYEYRCDQITKFAREAWEAANRIKPGIEMSADVFKNPALSGRNIGQRWTDFAPYVDLLVPMCYKSHFAGDIPTFYKFLGEYTRYENEWAKGITNISIALDIHYLYGDRTKTIDEIRASLKKMKGIANISEIESIKKKFKEVHKQLDKASPALDKEISNGINKLAEKDTIKLNQVIDTLDSKLAILVTNAPKGFYPEEILLGSIKAVRDNGGKGLVIFCAYDLKRFNLWGALDKAFSEPSIDQDIAEPVRGVNINAVRELEKLEKQK
ncbi:MAG: putative glycoside hydrolase [bacterium]|nr:putative glycoside hydrolase [bacterium]